ncbi:MAG: hypothetical protein CFH33_01219 [Alphaproteobacteria bacterium MarineAlpha9_Bin3]|nr:MAG: hypothetical protein CFH33_01219 [Alphaproteobacteria bacterium MarineAlpha9_Bin3]
MKTTIFLFFIFFFANISIHASDKHTNFTFKSHEAIYKLNIGKVTNSSQVHNAVGQMHLSVKEVCNGWVVNQNTTIDITDKNGSQVRNTFRYSSWESKNHDTFRFISKVIINDKEVITYEGKSKKTENHAEVEYIKPSNKIIKIPTDTLYPIQHFFSILENDLTNKFNNSLVFTGENDESLNNVTTFILDRMSNYKVLRSANFLYGDVISEPKNEIETLVSLNDGVVHKVIFDYFDYQIIGSLKKHYYINKPDC